jgi:hypothetical protein
VSAIEGTSCTTNDMCHSIHLHVKPICTTPRAAFSTAVLVISPNFTARVSSTHRDAGLILSDVQLQSCAAAMASTCWISELRLVSQMLLQQAGQLWQVHILSI